MIRGVFSLMIAVLSMINAQGQTDCNPYMLLSEGSSWEMESYNAKDKYQGKQSYEVVSVEGDQNSLVATVRFQSFDKKDVEVMNDEMSFSCEDGVVKMDMSEYVPAEMIANLESMEFEIEVDNMSMPAELSVGKQLDDGSMNMSAQGPVPINIKVEVVDRKVEAKETITVPAGDFEAYKISSTLKTSGMFKTERKNIEYIAEGVGAVKTESYKKNGKLDSYTVLSSFSRD